MARFNADTVDKYGGQGGAGYFSLKDDKDVARVRFLYNSIDDVEGYAVHQVEVDGKKRWVNCLREYNQPIDTCPFCREKKRVQAKLFVPLYNIDEEKEQVWERGKKFFAKITSVCARYASNGNLVSHIFEIERNGKKGDTSTTYEIYEIEKDDTTMDDMPEVPDPIGSVILDKSADDMEFYLENGYFPPTGDDAPVRRRASRSEDEDVPFEEDRTERRNVRRTPAGSRRDRF